MGNVGWVDHENFKNFRLSDIYSRKITLLIANIVLFWKSKHVVFTYFKTKGGVMIIHSLFKMCGINTEIYSGDISEARRRNILKVFNSEANRYGSIIKALLITEAGAEGINVLEAGHIHILESSPREMKIQQAIGRVVRYRSHRVLGRKPMPKNEQVVHIWRYWSVSGPEEVTVTQKVKKKTGEVVEIKNTITNKNTIDILLYEKGRLYVNGMQSFLQLLKNSSVTLYDRKIDAEKFMKDYSNIPVQKDIAKACQISDERYLKSRFSDPFVEKN